jgi:hypothetical protein
VFLEGPIEERVWSPFVDDQVELDASLPQTGPELLNLLRGNPGVRPAEQSQQRAPIGRGLAMGVLGSLS